MRHYQIELNDGHLGNKLVAKRIVECGDKEEAYEIARDMRREYDSKQGACGAGHNSRTSFKVELLEEF